MNEYKDNNGNIITTDFIEQGNGWRIDFSANHGQHGYLEYAIFENALEIHTIMANPNGQKLGSLLMYEVANRSAFHFLDTINVLNVAPTSVRFFEAMGFRLILKGTANWTANRYVVLQGAYNHILGTWI